MASPVNLEVGLSEALSQAAESGNKGGFSVVGGGGRTANTFLWVVGGVALVVLFLIFRKRR